MPELLLKHEVYQIVGAAFQVYNELGTGFLEAVYQEALEVELRARGVPFEATAQLRIRYKGQLLEKHYVCDVICFDCVIVELKAMVRLTSLDEAQLLNYIKASGHRVGLLLNFGAAGGLEWRRYVR
ncbi:MAG: GxxExxY protein [Planctomycetota bacterium]